MLTSALWVELPSADGAYSRMPRLIRQSSDVWGDRQTNAKYESDIAYYLFGLAAQELDGALAPSTSARPHLRLALESISEHLKRAEDGSEEGSLLGDLGAMVDRSTLNRLLPLVESDQTVDVTKRNEQFQAGVRIALFAQFLLTQVILIDVRAPDEDTAFSLFEPLNTTGQPLTPIETLKPLAVTAEGGLDEYVGSPCDLAFQTIDRYAPDHLEASVRAQRVSALLTSFALGQDGTKLAHNMLEQRRYLRTAFEDLSHLGAQRDFVRGIADTSVFLSEVWEEPSAPIIASATPADRVALEVLRSSKHFIVVPLLVRYYERATQTGTKAAKSDFWSVVRAVAAFWTLWRSSRTTTSGIDGVHRALIKTGQASTSLPALGRSSTATKDLPSVAALQATLRDLLERRLHITDEASWARLVNSQQLYETSRILARYILVCAHDDAVVDVARDGQMTRGASGCWTTLTPEVWAGHYTVEHIAPQNKNSADASYSQALYDEGDINRLGNLTLLPQDLNSLVGNRSWSFKREVFGMLAETDKTKRVAALKQGDLYGLGAKSKALLESSDFMPFCKFVAEYKPKTIDRKYVANRGTRIAELAWERLWADLT